MPSQSPKVSVVVPIYGVEKYLRQCVESILAQTLKDIEVILVDDGSKDACPQMVDEFAKKDTRVVPVHQPNGGYGKAVNHGIALAKGEYIGIIESDDWIEPDMYEKLYHAAKTHNADVVKCRFYVYNSFLPAAKQNKIYEGKHQDLSLAPEGVFSVAEWPKIIAFHASIWAALYEARFIKQQKLSETKSASYQDFPFMIETMCRAKRIAVVQDPLVHYRMEEGQNSSTIRRDERLLMMARQCMAGAEVLQRYGLMETLKEEFYFHCLKANWGFYHLIEWRHKRQYWDLLRSLFAPLAEDKNFHYRLFRKKEKNFVQALLKNRFWNKENLKLRRRFYFSVNFSRKHFHAQLLGLQFQAGKFEDRDCWYAVKIK